MHHNFSRSTISSVLGSMSPDTSCMAHMTYAFPGSPSYRETLGLRGAQSQEISEAAIQKGYQNHVRKNLTENEIISGDQSVNKHRYMNYRQYVGRHSS